jgi:hypothetical protein
MEYKLFTTRFCHKCPAMKEFMGAQTKVSGAIIDASTPEGLNEARRFNVTGVPTVVFLDEAGTEVKRCGCKEEVEEVLMTV